MILVKKWGGEGTFIESVIKFASIFSRKLPINHHYIYKLELIWNIYRMIGWD